MDEEEEMSTELKLYEIVQEMTDAIELYSKAESDEELLEVEKKLNDIQISFNDKAVAVSRYIRNIEGNQSAVKAEIERLSKLLKTYEGEEEWLRGYLKRSMEATNTQKIQSPIFKIAIVKNNPSVNVLDEKLVPEEYKRTTTTITVDKRKILELNKQGIGVDGTEIIRNTRLSIS
jgi:hypothetical protein